MGRRGKNQSPSKPAPVQTLLPKPEGLQDGSVSGIQFLPNLLRLPNIHLANLTVGMTQQPFIRAAPTMTTPGQKLLLPKLPPGVRAPSKIIVVNNSESGHPRVHVINTSQSSSGTSEEVRKRMMLTGELNVARNILPRPESLVLRPRKTLVMSKAPEVSPQLTSGTTTTAKVAIPKLQADESSHHGRKRSVRKITEDASDGFEVYDEDGGEAIRLAPTSQGIFQIQLPAGLLGPGRAILPKPASVEAQAQMGNLIPTLPQRGNLGSVSLQSVFSIGPATADAAPDPDDFRPPKRTRTMKKRQALATHTSEKTGRRPRKEVYEQPEKRKVGRPSVVHLPTLALIKSAKSDCLVLASDGSNLKCLACRCRLTSTGQGTLSKISKHLHADRNHKVMYEAWKARQGLASEDAETTSSESARLADKEKSSPSQKVKRLKVPEKKPVSPKTPLLKKLPVILQKPAPVLPVLNYFTVLKQTETPQFILINPQHQDVGTSLGSGDPDHGEMDIAETHVDTTADDAPLTVAEVHAILCRSGLPGGSEDESYESCLD